MVLDQLTGSELMKDIRAFIKAHPIKEIRDIKTSGRGRTKVRIVKDVNRVINKKLHPIKEIRDINCNTAGRGKTKVKIVKEVNRVIKKNSRAIRSVTNPRREDANNVAKINCVRFGLMAKPPTNKPLTGLQRALFVMGENIEQTCEDLVLSDLDKNRKRRGIGRGIKDNPVLRKNVIHGITSPLELVVMTNDEMANAQVRDLRKETAAKNKKQHPIIHEAVDPVKRAGYRKPMGLE